MIKEYSKLRQRIKEYQKIENQNTTFHTIEARTFYLLNELRNVAVKDDLNIILNSLASLVLLLSLVSIFQGTLLSSFVCVVFGIAAIFYYHIAVNQLLKKNLMKDSSVDFEEKLTYRMDYGLRGVFVKSSRIRLVKRSLIVCSSLSLILAVQVFPITTSIDWFYIVPLAISLSAVFWFFYFQSEVNHLSFFKNELELCQSNFVKSIKVDTDQSFVTEEYIDYIEPSVESSVFDLEQVDEVSASKTKKKIIYEQLKLDM